jgi:hypothetical protein
MKTIQTILAEVHQHKTCTKRQIYRYFKLFGIEPVGVRQRPRLYPDSAAQTILIKLGLAADSAGCDAPGCQDIEAKVKRLGQNLAQGRPWNQGIATMKQLRAERAKGQRRAA